jgi:hypothetical protein
MANKGCRSVSGVHWGCMAESNDEMPLVRIAAVADRVLQEKDETISLIRIIDRFTLTLTQGDAPEGSVVPPGVMPPSRLGLNVILSTVAGQARGARSITLGILRPDGTRSLGPNLEIECGQDIDAQNWVVQLTLQVVEPGTYWIEWECNGRLLTRVPLQIRYVRQLKLGAEAP